MTKDAKINKKYLDFLKYAKKEIESGKRLNLAKMAVKAGINANIITCLRQLNYIEGRYGQYTWVKDEPNEMTVTKIRLHHKRNAYRTLGNSEQVRVKKDNHNSYRDDQLKLNLRYTKKAREINVVDPVEVVPPVKVQLPKFVKVKLFFGLITLKGQIVY